MPNPFKQGDEAKEKYLEQAMHANEEATSGAKMSDLFNKSSAVYKEDPASIPKRVPEPLPEKPTVDEEGYPIVEQVHTYKEDLAGIVKADKLSLSRIAIMEGTANKGLTKDPNYLPPKKQVNVLLIVSITLIVMGIGIAGGVFMLAIQRNTNEQISQTQTTAEKYIIFSESNEAIQVKGATKTQVGAQIATLIQNFREEGGIMEVIPADTVSTTTASRVPLSEVFSTTNSRMPDSLARTLEERFFLGLHSQKGITYPFLLFYAESYDIAYPAMLSWEGFMPDDMTWIFPKPAAQGTSTPAFSFKDRVIGNSDARSYEDAQGRSAFFYMFLDDHTILMARTADTVRAVQDRIREAKFQ
ncbi:MAG: hypothetical protein WC761_06275 [Candidatus Paceibacterota bacterium]|jgi:hypothetical protein